MAELRHEYLDDRWTLYAADRAERPLPPPPPPGPPPPAFDAECPFCPGNEALAGAIRYEAPPVAGAGPTPWAARSVENKYPILRPEPSPTAAGAGACDLRGAHEVIVETPRHDHDLTAMTGAELRAAVAVYRDRQRALEGRWGWATLFRNRSGQAGASLVHPHAQIVAAEEAPPPIRAREARAGAYFARHGRTYLADAIARARAGEGGARVVLDRGTGSSPSCRTPPRCRSRSGSRPSGRRPA